MTIDERLDRLVERHEALAQSVESLTRDIHQMQESMARDHAIMLKMDARERAGRNALLAGIRAYLEGLEENGEEN
jgi:archaellum component FlaC